MCFPDLVPNRNYLHRPLILPVGYSIRFVSSILNLIQCITRTYAYKSCTFCFQFFMGKWRTVKTRTYRYLIFESKMLAASESQCLLLRGDNTTVILGFEYSLILYAAKALMEPVNRSCFSCVFHQSLSLDEITPASPAIPARWCAAFKHVGQRWMNRLKEQLPSALEN